MKKFLAMLLAIVLCMGLVAFASENASAEAVKNTLVVGLTQEPSTFETINSNTDQKDVPVLFNVYDTLVRVNAAGEVEPHLAKSWEVSEDGCEYTLHLEENVYFHDGSKFTAEDAAFSIEAVKDTLLGNLLLVNLDHCEVVDEYTVKCILTGPFSSFMTGLSSRVAPIYSKAYYDAVGVEGIQEAPMGTGPYVWVERVPGDRIIMKRNENWWKGEVPIENVTLKLIIDPNTQIIALETGEVDLLLNPTVSYLTHLDENSGVTWSYGSSAGQEFLSFTDLSTWGSNENFRKAIQYAVDKEEILIAVMEGYSYILDMSMPYAYSGAPDVEDVYVVQRDLDKAKEYLAASGYNGEPFKVLVSTGLTGEDIAKVLQGQLQQELGINMEIMSVDSATFASMLSNRDQYDAVCRFYQVSLNDADGVAMCYASSGVVNEFGYWDFTDEADEIFEQGRVLTGEARKEVYARLMTILNESAVRIPFFCAINTVAYNENLKGVVSHPLNFYFYDQFSW